MIIYQKLLPGLGCPQNTAEPVLDLDFVVELLTRESKLLPIRAVKSMQCACSLIGATTNAISQSFLVQEFLSRNSSECRNKG